MADEQLHAPTYADGYEHLSEREERAVDDKGRIILPAGHWREAFAGGARLSPFGDCLALWTLRSYGEVVARIHADQRAGQRRPGTLQAFRRDTKMVALDNQGRLTLPAELRDLVGIGGHGSMVAIEGQGDHLEIRPAGQVRGMPPAELTAELTDFAADY